MPSPRYTVRLPPALDALVQARIRTTGTPFAVLVREALAAYLADTPLTPALTDPPTVADTVQALREQVEALAKRVAALERQPTRRRQGADRTAGNPPTDADTTAPGYDPTRFVLGKLCPRGHAYGQTGQTLLRLPSRNCPTCTNASKRERRQAQRERPG